LNLISNKNWTDLENEVDKLEQSDNEYKSTVGFITDDEIAVLANEMNAPKSINELRNHQSSTPLVKKQHQQHHESTPSEKDEAKNQGSQLQQQQQLHMRKHSILRKLMIAQRKKFLMKKEQADYNKLKKKLNDASISNFSQASEYIKFNDMNNEKKINNNSDQNDNVK
jgi:hypothetical protein